MGRVAADHRTQGDQHLVLTRAGHLLGHDRQFERTRHPGHVQLGAGLRHIHAMALEAVETAAQQLGGDQIIETGHDDADAQPGCVRETSFKRGHWEGAD